MYAMKLPNIRAGVSFNPILCNPIQATVPFCTDALARFAKAMPPKHSGGGLSRVSLLPGWVS